MQKKILVIEDEKDIRDLLQFYLEREGYKVKNCADGESALRGVAQESFDLALLDLMLPGVDGLEVCRKIRSDPRTADLPIIILTAKGGEADRIVGLELGADDYVTKPFSPREVVARIKALFRRFEKPKAKEVKQEYRGSLLDPERYEVSFEGKVQELTTKEFKLLEFLMTNRGRALSREQLLNKIWDANYFGTTRTVDVHVAHLRRKFPLLSKYLTSVKGVGYKLLDK